jgi:hypothetical protein
MNFHTPKDTPISANPSPIRIAIPDGKGGYVYEQAEMFDLRKPRKPGLLPVEVRTRRGAVAAPDQADLKMPAPHEKRR